MIVLCAFHKWSSVILLNSLLSGRTRMDLFHLLRAGTVFNKSTAVAVAILEKRRRPRTRVHRPGCTCVSKATYKGFLQEECDGGIQRWTMDSTFQFDLHNIESSVPLVAPKFTGAQESVHIRWRGVIGRTGHVTVHVKSSSMQMFPLHFCDILFTLKCC